MSEELTYEKLMASIQASITRAEKDTARAKEDTARAKEDRERADEEYERVKADRERADKEHERMKAEMREYQREATRAREAASAETDRQLRETDRQLRETRILVDDMVKSVKDVTRQLGGIGNSNGAMAESYFFNSLDKTKMFGSEKFDHAEQNIKMWRKGLRDEYDIVLYNGRSVSIIEVKYNAEKKHITQTIGKATTFRTLFPEYKDFTFYLGIASLSFDKDVEQAALDAGLAVIKQVGDAVVVQDERLQKF